MTDSYEEIAKLSFKQLEKGSAEEMSDLIFDTLFGNTNFPQFDLNYLSDIYEEVQHEVNRKEKTIEFGYLGHHYRINIELVK